MTSPGIDRSALSRVIAVINGKGGVGKTTIVANTGGLLARSGYRVLLVDLDPQGNLGLDLGYADDAGRDDAGASLTAALLGLGSVRVLPDVRDGLDIIVGGSRLHDAAAALAAARTGTQPRLALARVLTPLAADYDLVLIDCPPGNESLQTAAICCARWALVPARIDEGTARGLTEIAQRLNHVLDTNPDLDLLGIVLFDIERQATRIDKTARQMIAETVGSASATFTTSIRHSSAVAQQVRRNGLLIHELDEYARQQPEWWQLRRGETADGERATYTAASVADDLHAITEEIVERLTARESEAVA